MAPRFVGFCVFLILWHVGNSIKCYSCNSKQDKECSDPFLNFNLTGPGLQTVDCVDEISIRNFIAHFSNLLSVLGMTNFDQKNVLNKIQDGNQLRACQKVEFYENSEKVTIRECAVLSEIICDSLKYGSDSNSDIEFCEICSTNYCNAASKLFNGWNLLSLIILTNRVIV